MKHSVAKAGWAALTSSCQVDDASIVYDPHQTIERVYFPINGAVSLVVPMSSGEIVETAMVGRDGMLDAAAVIDGRVSINRAVVQLSGACHYCEANSLRQILGQCRTLYALIAKHEQVLLAHTQQSAACNATHDLESRLARWLLRARDLVGSDDLELTQGYIAEMLGVRRTSVTLVAHSLQQAGLLRYSRGHIRIVNVEALRELACECYEVVKLHYETLLHAASNE